MRSQHADDDADLTRLVHLIVTIDGHTLPVHKFEIQREIVGFGLGVGRGHRAFTFATPPAVINICDDDDVIMLDTQESKAVEDIGVITAEFVVVEKQAYVTHARRQHGDDRPARPGES
mgnify:CR=1 FL=1